jgi:hypothetical protein
LVALPGYYLFIRYWGISGRISFQLSLSQQRSTLKFISKVSEQMFQSQSSPHPSGVVCCFSVSHDDPLSFYWTNGLSVVWILNAHNQFLMVSAINLCQGTMAFFPYPCRTDKLGLSHLAHGFSLSETRLCKEISQYPERTRHGL